ncbi:MAG: hypothetical protein ACLU33_04910 [Christensenellales bacterium]
MKKFKSDKGITLLALSIYIIAISLILGLLATLNNFFSNNIKVVRDSSKYATSFDKFNSFFVEDVKNSKNAKIETNDNNITITFDNGSTYFYKDDDGGLYRGKVKIASSVTNFTATSKTVVINNTEKEIITIDIAIGGNGKNTFSKKIDYTLKYW